MQVFKAFLKILLKNINVACIYLSVFLGIAIPMAKVAPAEDKFTAQKMDVCIFDEDNTPESQALADYIASIHDIKKLENDKDTITDALYYESVDYVLTIKQGYAQSLVTGEGTMLESTKMHESYSTVYMGQLLSEYVSTVRTYRMMEGDTMAAIARAEETLAKKIEVSFPEKAVEERSDFTQSFANYFQYMPYILISIFMSVLITVLRALNDGDMRRRTNCAPITTGSYTAQVFMGCGIFVAAVWVIMVGVGAMLNGGGYAGRALMAVGNSLVFTVVAALMAIFVASFGPDIMLQNLLNQILGLGMSFLCGIFIPQSMLSEGVLNAGKILPAYWYVKANNMLCGRDTYDSGTFGVCIGVQIGFAAAFAIGTLIVTHRKKQTR